MLHYLNDVRHRITWKTSCETLQKILNLISYEFGNYYYHVFDYIDIVKEREPSTKDKKYFRENTEKIEGIGKIILNHFYYASRDYNPYNPLRRIIRIILNNYKESVSYDAKYHNIEKILHEAFGPVNLKSFEINETIFRIAETLQYNDTTNWKILGDAFEDIGHEIMPNLCRNFNTWIKDFIIEQGLKHGYELSKVSDASDDQSSSGAVQDVHGGQEDSGGDLPDDSDE